jgi:hypothetical protein
MNGSENLDAVYPCACSGDITQECGRDQILYAYNGDMHRVGTPECHVLMRFQHESAATV